MPYQNKTSKIYAIVELYHNSIFGSQHDLLLSTMFVNGLNFSVEFLVAGENQYFAWELSGDWRQTT